MSSEVTLSMCRRSCCYSKEIRVRFGRACGNQSSRPGLDFELPFYLREGRSREGRRRMTNPPRKLQISPVFQSVFSKRERKKKKASVRLAFYSGSSLPATRIPRHLSSLPTSRLGPSAAGRRRSSPETLRPALFTFELVPRVRVADRRAQSALRSRASGSPGRRGRTSARVRPAVGRLRRPGLCR